MDTMEIRSTDLKGSLVDTTTDRHDYYELTDRQESNTSSPQAEFVLGLPTAFTL